MIMMTPQERKELYENLKKKFGIDAALVHKHNEYTIRSNDEISGTTNINDGKSIPFKKRHR